MNTDLLMILAYPIKETGKKVLSFLLGSFVTACGFITYNALSSKSEVVVTEVNAEADHCAEQSCEVKNEDNTDKESSKTTSDALESRQES